MNFAKTAVLIVILASSFPGFHAAAALIHQSGEEGIAKQDSASETESRPTTLTIFAGLQRGMRTKQEVEGAPQANWLLGVSVNPPIGTRWRIPIELSLWKWKEDRNAGSSLRISVSAAYEILESGRLRLYVASGLGIFVLYLPAAMEVGGGFEYLLSKSARLMLNVRTLLDYHTSELHPPMILASPVVVTVGFNFTVK